jgi:hypothetical protein
MFKMPNTSRKRKIALKNVHHFKNARTTSAESTELHTKLYRPIQNIFSNLQFFYLEINGSKLVLLFFVITVFLLGIFTQILNIFTLQKPFMLSQQY